MHYSFVNCTTLIAFILMLWTTKGAYRYDICLLLIYTIPMLILRFVRFEPLCNRSSLPTSSSSMLYKQISRRTANILLALAGCAFALALGYSRYSSCSAACFLLTLLQTLGTPQRPHSHTLDPRPTPIPIPIWDPRRGSLFQHLLVAASVWRFWIVV